MIEQTKIEWTDFTVNFWEGCQKVGPGCDHCYAEARDVRFTAGKHWGPGAPRREVISGIKKLEKINRDGVKFFDANGHFPRVFCSSLSDVFDNAVDPQWRVDAFKAVDQAPNTRIQMLTKRVGNVEKMVPDMWRDGGWPSHVGLMITVVNQKEADRDIPKLLDLKARFGIPWVGLSIEPMLGPIDLYWPQSIWPNGPDTCCSGYHCGCMGQPVEPWLFYGIDWVVCGGESGREARPMHPDWARSLRDQCEGAGTPFLFKQWGEWVSVSEVEGPGAHHKFEDGATVRRAGKKLAGRTLDGVTHDAMPKGLN